MILPKAIHLCNRKRKDKHFRHLQQQIGLSKNHSFRIALQTNSTLINDEFALFFKENGFLIGVSLDGDKEVNKYRIYPNGKSSFDDILKGIDI